MDRQTRSVYDVLQFWLASWRFPLFAISFLSIYVTLQVLILAIPISGSSTLAAFADEFKTWCFGYDPESKQYQIAYLVMMIVNPLMIMGLIAGVWWQPLKQLWQAHRRTYLKVPVITGSIAFAILASLVLLMEKPDQSANREWVFPAEELRTHYRSAPIDLINQHGDNITLSDYRGKVVLVTAVYATCGYTCPMIMAQAKSAIDALDPEERDHLQVLAITLDPAKDSPAVLAGLAQGRELPEPTFQLLTGPVDQVNRTLDAYDFSRTRNPETGVIDHANLFILIDRKGTIAYRFTLGDRQEEWLVKAMRMLLREDVS